MACEAAALAGLAAGASAAAVAVLALLNRAWRRRGRLAALALSRHRAVADAVAADARAQATRIRPGRPGRTIRAGRRFWIAARDWRAALAARKRRRRGW